MMTSQITAGSQKHVFLLFLSQTLDGDMSPSLRDAEQMVMTSGLISAVSPAVEMSGRHVPTRGQKHQFSGFCEGPSVSDLF